MQFGTGNQKNNVFCLLIRQFFVIFVKMKTADGTFGYGHCRDMEDSYSAWKQVENIKSLDPLLYSKLTHQKNIRIK